MKKIGSYIKPVLFFSLAVFLLFVSFKGISWSEFNNVLKEIPLKWIFLSMFFGYLAYVFRGLRWYLLIKPLGFKPKRIDLVNAIAFGYLFNSLIPRSGELARCTALNRVSGIPISKLFGHVLLERLIDVFMLLICMLLAFFLNYQDFLSFAKLISIPDNILLYTVLLILLMYIVYKLIKLLLWPLYAGRIKGFLNGIKTGFLSIRKIPNNFTFLIYTLLIWICYLIMTVVCFFCFSETKDLNLGQGLFILIAGGLGMVIPTPTGIGSYHYLVIQALVAIGVTRDIAQFFAIIVHSSQALMIIVAGFFGMSLLYQKKISK